jgi:regulator of cell morphogenesis and NO signaling
MKAETTDNLFTSRMKLADIITANHNIILLLPRFGIPLGFGDKSVREVCTANNVPVDFMLLICNVYTFDDYLPDIESLAATDMRPLLKYLEESHSYYTNERLPHIEVHLHHIADRIGQRYGEILKKFYADFRREITEHFREEEQYDFPKLRSLQDGTRKAEGGRRKAESGKNKSHNGLVDKLNDLTQIVYKYLPGNVLPEETMEVVFDILQLSADIQKHALIEDKILIPYMKWLERRLK